MITDKEKEKMTFNDFFNPRDKLMEIFDELKKRDITLMEFVERLKYDNTKLANENDRLFKLVEEKNILISSLQTVVSEINHDLINMVDKIGRER